MRKISITKSKNSSLLLAKFENGYQEFFGHKLWCKKNGRSLTFGAKEIPIPLHGTDGITESDRWLLCELSTGKVYKPYFDSWDELRKYISKNFDEILSYVESEEGKKDIDEKFMYNLSKAEEDYAKMKRSTKI